MRSDLYVRALLGPFGSGKSSGCAVEMLRRSTLQAPGPDGIRHSRWLIVRNTFPELRDTTRKTFSEWVADPLILGGGGEWSEATFSFHARFKDVDAEFLFRALDRPEDVKKLLSLEITGAWLNEAREIPKAVFELVQARTGRYPSMRNGGPSWHGIILDTNPPDTDHWFYKYFEELKPENAGIWRQPDGTTPKAENVENQPKDYYKNLAIGKSEAWVKVYIHGQYGFVLTGRAVYPEFRDNVHVQEPTPLTPTSPLLVGMDFGLTPAMVFAQRDPRDGQLQFIDELVADDLGAVRFAEDAARYIRSTYPKRPISGHGDPAGEQRAQTDERTPYDIVNSQGIPIGPAPTNDFTLRRESIARGLTRLTMLGRPAIVISAKCRRLRKAMNGGYQFKRVAAAGEDRFRDVPDKNEYSHVAEAAQYLAVGEGEDNRALDSSVERRRVALPFKTKRAFGRRRA